MKSGCRHLEDALVRTRHGFHVWAGDDSKVHRSSPEFASARLHAVMAGTDPEKKKSRLT
jgi:hypothetical protein